MDINKGLLWADCVAPSNNAVTGKIIDFGCSVNFDHNNHVWNRIFVAAPACANCTGVALTVYTAKSYEKKPYSQYDLIVKDGEFKYATNAITTAEDYTAAHWTSGVNASSPKQTVTLNASALAKFKLGGAFLFDMPEGLNRYIRVDATFTTASPSKVTIGLTNEIDTDCVLLGGGIDWTFYKAVTSGTELKNTPMQNVAEVIGSGSATNDEVTTIASTLVGAHEKTSYSTAASKNWGTSHNTSA